MSYIYVVYVNTHSKPTIVNGEKTPLLVTRPKQPTYKTMLFFCFALLWSVELLSDTIQEPLNCFHKCMRGHSVVEKQHF